MTKVIPYAMHSYLRENQRVIDVSRERDEVIGAMSPKRNCGLKFFLSKKKSYKWYP